MSLIHRASGSGVAYRDFARQFAGITIASMVEAYLLWTAGKGTKRRIATTHARSTAAKDFNISSTTDFTATSHHLPSSRGAVKSLRLILPRHLSHGWPIETCCVAPGDVFEEERQARQKAPEAAKSERSLLAHRSAQKPSYRAPSANGLGCFVNSPTPQDISNVVALTASLLASGVMSRSHYDPELARTVVTHAIAIYADIKVQLGTTADARDSKAKT